MSGLMDAGDWADIAADLATIRGDNPVSITLRRGGSPLAAQQVRIVGQGGQGRRERTDGAAASVARVAVLGALTMDVQPDDQFSYGGAIYTVVAPVERRGGQTTCEAEVQQ